MSLRAELCYALSRQLIKPPATRTSSAGAYDEWRTESLSRSWSAFDDADVRDKDVLDFGCGDGQLSFFLGLHKQPRSIVGVDLNAAAIDRARHRQAGLPAAVGGRLTFELGHEDALPVPDESVDTLVAFDCLEHVMSPARILADWRRVLRPGGRCLVEWFPYKGPWGPHMESLIPIPWAHVLFGEYAMLRAAERIYDHPRFEPRHWDLDEHGRKKPNKWKAWSSFEQQGYINKLDLRGFEALVGESGLVIDRLARCSFGGSAMRRKVGHALMRMPVIGEYFVSYVAIELRRPA